MKCDIYGCQSKANFQLIISKRKWVIFWKRWQTRNLCELHEKQVEGFTAELPKLIKEDPMDTGESGETYDKEMRSLELTKQT